MLDTIKEIKTAISSLFENEYKELRDWFSERNWKKWDDQLEKDIQEGKLDFLIQEAMMEKAQGSLRKL